MPAYTIELTPSASRQFKNLERSVQRRVSRKIDALQVNPRPHGVEKLGGEDSLYRVRVGNYRIVYQILDGKLLVLVLRIADRKDVYR